MSRKFDFVIFDFDGTVADTGKGIFTCASIAVKELGFEPLSDAQLRTFVGPPLLDSFMRTLAVDEATAAQAVSIYRANYSESGIYMFELYEGMDSLIRTLHASGIKLAIASAKPEKFIRKIIEHLNYGEFFGAISAPDLNNTEPSKTALVESVCAALGADKSGAVMIGDRHFDILGAKEAGVKSIGVTYGFGSREELTLAGADFLAESVADLKEILL